MVFFPDYKKRMREKGRVKDFTKEFQPVPKTDTKIRKFRGQLDNVIKHIKGYWALY